MYRARGIRKAVATNANTSAFTAKTALRTTEPSGNLVFRLADEFGGLVPSHARIFPYGLGSDNDAFSLRVWGWTRYGTVTDASAGTSRQFWLPSMFLEISATISAFVGVAGYAVLNTERFADTITVVATVGEPKVVAGASTNGIVIVYSPVNDTPAWVETPLWGAELLEFDFDQTTNTPTMNAMLHFYDITDD